jgi:hypothetical protein
MTKMVHADTEVAKQIGGHPVTEQGGMDPDLKAKWVAALRSGRFRQARMKLRSEDGFCCLGVLCVVAGLPITEDGQNVVGVPDSYDPIWNLTGRDGWGLTSLNDGGLSFAEIADYIETNIPARGGDQ